MMGALAKYLAKAKGAIGPGMEKGLELATANPVATGGLLGAGAGAAMADEDESALEGALEGGIGGAGASAIAGSPEIAKLLAKLGL